MIVSFWLVYIQLKWIFSHRDHRKLVWHYLRHHLVKKMGNCVCAEQAQQREAAEDEEDAGSQRVTMRNPPVNRPERSTSHVSTQTTDYSPQDRSYIIRKRSVIDVDSLVLETLGLIRSLVDK